MLTGKSILYSSRNNSLFLMLLLSLQEELPPFLKDTNDTPVEIEESHESCDQPSEVEKRLSTIVVPNTIRYSSHVIVT